MEWKCRWDIDVPMYCVTSYYVDDWLLNFPAFNFHYLFYGHFWAVTLGSFLTTSRNVIRVFNSMKQSCPNCFTRETKCY